MKLKSTGRIIWVGAIGRHVPQIAFENYEAANTWLQYNGNYSSTERVTVMPVSEYEIMNEEPNDG